jgi:hypothetical protein
VCPGYFPVWGRDCAAVIRHNISELGDRHDMVTLTAPGTDGLGWDRSKCTHPTGARCSGKLGCVVEGAALDRFIADLEGNMRRLLRAAKERTRRRGFRPPPMVVTMEPQDRGAPHFHLVASTTDREAFRCFFEQAAELAPRYGFGRRVGWDPWRGDDRKGNGGAARYLSKVGAYLAKAGEGDQVAEQLRRMLKRAPNSRIVRCSPALTRCSGVTMRNLRLKRWAWAITGGHAMSCTDAAALHRSYREYRERERVKRLALLAHAIQSGAPPDAVWRLLRICR